MHDLSSQSRQFSTESLIGSKVAVVGDGPISNFLCAYLSALGVGNMVLVGDGVRRSNIRNEPFSEFSKKSNPKVINIAETISRINKDINVMPYYSVLDRSFVSGCSVIVDTTNDPDSKYIAQRYARSSGAMLVSCSSSSVACSISSNGRQVLVNRQSGSVDGQSGSVDGQSGSVDRQSGSAGRRYGSDIFNLDDILMREFSDVNQGHYTSSLIAALAADEIRKIICPLDADVSLDRRNSYSLLDPARFFNGGVPESFLGTGLSRSRRDGKKALVVGAGGIGTYVLLNLAMAGYQIELYDDDVVEQKNLNRQVIHFDAVGENKAEEAERKLRFLDRSLVVHGRAERFTLDTMREKVSSGERYDVVFSCVDSWQSRQILNRYCTLTGTPLINGGVGTFIGLVDYFIPGKNHCLECNNDYKKRIAAELNPAHCGGLSANVVMPNAVAGSIMVAEAEQIFSNVVTPLYDRRFKYNSNLSSDAKFVLEAHRMSCITHDDHHFDCRCHDYIEG